MVVGMHEQTRVFIRGCLSFMEQLTLSQSEVEDTVRRKTNVLLERLCHGLRNVISEKSLSLVQVRACTHMCVSYVNSWCKL
jgi:hypothetical protein